MLYMNTNSKKIEVRNCSAKNIVENVQTTKIAKNRIQKYSQYNLLTGVVVESSFCWKHKNWNCCHNKKAKLGKKAVVVDTTETRYLD